LYLSTYDIGDAVLCAVRSAESKTGSKNKYKCNSYESILQVSLDVAIDHLVRRLAQHLENLIVTKLEAHDEENDAKGDESEAEKDTGHSKAGFLQCHFEFLMFLENLIIL
jgi:hypothetical protein